MPEAPHLTPVPDIDRAYQPTHDERCRQQTVSILRKHILVDMLAEMKADYEEQVKPQYARAHGAPPATAKDIARAMADRHSFRFYTQMRYDAQEMTWDSVLSPIERAADDMISVARDIALSRPTGGSLKLDPAVAIPAYQTTLDIHLTPGGFHREYAADDVTQAAVIAMGTAVFSGGIAHRKGNPGGSAESVAAYLRWAYPDFTPRRILDLGTSSGKNLFPYLAVFPHAEAFGVDVSAPLLRYGHAKAEQAGLVVHFSQQNAEAMDFADGTFDLIVSSFFLHEVSLPATRRILKECHRLLAPGGVMLHVEPPFQKSLDPWMNFFWDWDSKYNAEPARIILRSQDPLDLLTGAGFRREECLEVMIPNLASHGPAKFKEILEGRAPCPAHGKGGWYNFGARKAS